MASALIEHPRSRAELGTTTDVGTHILSRMPRMHACDSPSGFGDIHYEDADHPGPIACTAEEGLLLNLTARLMGKVRVLEIGSYVGWSTAHLLVGTKAMVDAVDPFVEYGGSLGVPREGVSVRFWENMRELEVDHRVDLHMAYSPGVLPQIASEPWDLVFIDGWHFDGQPMKDVEGVMPFVTETGIIILHDLWIPDVAAAGDWLVRSGWTRTTLPTANLLSWFWRAQPSWWGRFLKTAKEIGND